MEWLYQEIMRHIEPDLTLQRFPQLDKIYAGESKTNRTKRMKWYDSAFALYDRIFADVSAMYNAEAHSQRHAKHKKAAARETREEGEELEKIETIIDSHLSDA